MKGASAGKPGEVQIIEFPDMQLEAGDIIVNPLACGICTTDVKMVQKGTKEKKYALGHELAGMVIETTPQSRWQAGQRVIVAPYLPCGGCYFCLHNQQALCTHLYDVTIYPGGLAENVYVPRALAERGVFAIPDHVPNVVAALAEPVGCVLKGLEDSFYRYGNSVLVVGDGPMGLFTAAAARVYGASPVIVAGMTPHRLEIAQAFFADIIVDITRENLISVVHEHTADRGADIVMVAVSTAEALASGIEAVRPGGTVNAFAGVPEGSMVSLDIRKIHYGQFYLTGSSGVTPAHLEKALRLLSSKRMDFSQFITAQFPFSDVAEAVAYVDNRTGLKAMVTFE